MDFEREQKAVGECMRFVRTAQAACSGHDPFAADIDTLVEGCERHWHALDACGDGPQVRAAKAALVDGAWDMEGRGIVAYQDEDATLRWRRRAKGLRARLAA